MEQINWTPILNAALALIGLILTGVLIPWIRSKTDTNKLQEKSYWVEVAVTAAFQLFGYNPEESRDETNERRKEYVHAFLRSKGYDIDESTINLIEAMVIQVKAELFGGHQE